MADTAISPGAAGTSSGIVNISSGTFTGAATTTTTINLGFVPRWAKIFTPTGVLIWEKFASGMAAANCLKVVTAGTTTLDTGSHVLFTGNTIVLTATVCVNADVISWIAIG